MNKSHHRAGKEGSVYVHVIEAEKMLGRPLKPGEAVHHKDKNKLNNSEDNLLVFTSVAEHTRFHNLKCREDLLIKLEDGSYICDPTYALQSRMCPICGNTKDVKAKMCIICRKNIRTQNIPSREDLKIKIEECDGVFAKVAKHYGVSDNAIRKWCKKYGMEHHALSYRGYCYNDDTGS